MKKIVYLIHGWGGYPEGGFRPWLKKDLEARGFEVKIPAMPDTDYPRLESWLVHLKRVINSLDQDTIIIGHSLGGNIALRFVEQIPEGEVINKLILVAPAINEIRELNDEEKIIFEPWKKEPIDFDKIKRSTKEIVAYFSDNDRWIPIETGELIQEKLEGRVVIIPGKGHFGDDEGVTEFKELRDEILK